MKEKYDKTYSPPDDGVGYHRRDDGDAAVAYRADQDVFGDEADAQVSLTDNSESK
jgi:hypothetical protein